MATGLRIKRGMPLVLEARFVDDNGADADLSSSQLRSSVRDLQDRLVTDVEWVISTDYAGLAQCNEPATADWPVGHLRFDLRLVGPEGVQLTETLPLIVSPAVTR